MLYEVYVLYEVYIDANVTVKLLESFLYNKVKPRSCKLCFSIVLNHNKIYKYFLKYVSQFLNQYHHVSEFRPIEETSRKVQKELSHHFCIWPFTACWHRTGHYSYNMPSDIR